MRRCIRQREASGVIQCSYLNHVKLLIFRTDNIFVPKEDILSFLKFLNLQISYLKNDALLTFL